MVRKEDSSVNLIVWNASLMSKVEKILARWKWLMFSSRVGMGYTGLMIVLIVCDGSRQMRTFAGFVSEAGRSRITIFEIQGVNQLSRVDKFV